MVQFNYNLTHAWDSMHGTTQVFACQMPKFAVELIISARREVLFTRNKTCHGHKSCHRHDSCIRGRSQPH